MESNSKTTPEPQKNLNIHIYLDPAIIAIFLCVCYSRVPINESDAILAYSWITFQVFAGIIKKIPKKGFREKSETV